MERSGFDRLLQRYLAGEVTVRETIKIESWLDKIKTGQPHEIPLTAEDEGRIFHAITNGSTNVIITYPKNEKRHTYWLLGIAASFLVIALISVSSWYILRTSDESKLPGSHIEKLILNDGSLVWLHGNAKLVYYHKQEGAADYRYSELTGEALFEVAKDANRPFIIRCGDVNVRVVGTSFNLKAIHDTLELWVLTGKVQLSTSGNPNRIDAGPNEKVVYKGNGRFEKISFAPTEEITITKGTEYRMTFTNATLATVIESLEKKFDVHVKIDNERVNACRITIDLTDRSLERSLQIITDVLDVSYTIEGSEVTLTGSGCD
jgi:ferric-dicitrate binding protein FerR (iron transport regulator)